MGFKDKFKKAAKALRQAKVRSDIRSAKREKKELIRNEARAELYKSRAKLAKAKSSFRKSSDSGGVGRGMKPNFGGSGYNAGSTFGTGAFGPINSGFSSPTGFNPITGASYGEPKKNKKKSSGKSITIKIN